MSAGRGLKLGIAAVVLGVAGVGYWFTGMPNYEAASVLAQANADARKEAQADPKADPQADAQARASAAPAMPDAAQIDAMVNKLVERLKEQPSDVQGWTMLGRAQTLLGRANEASMAYARAVALRGDDARLLVDYAEALGITAGNRLAGEPTKLIDRALRIDPAHPKALALAGAAAFDRKDYAAAVRHWEKLLAASAPEAEFVVQLRDGIAQARELGKLPTATVATAATGVTNATLPNSVAAAPASSFKVSGVITLAPALADKVRPDDTLFVFARAVNGPRMPLVILRKQARDLPLRFTLDDTMAMAGNAALLKDVQQVVVGARLSRSGQAMPQPGDVSGQSNAVNVGSAGVQILISELVP